ncbi:MAG: hypothetical protein RMK94_16730, partial [Armatimonadota bacterium]|nr:hypothetical protein [Armatimonadota bacterium]
TRKKVFSVKQTHSDVSVADVKRQKFHHLVLLLILSAGKEFPEMKVLVMPKFQSDNSQTLRLH